MSICPAVAVRGRIVPLVVLVLTVLALHLPGTGLAGSGGDNGTIPLLVKSRVPLTPDVVAAIGAHGTKVTFVWPEIDALALHVSPSKFAELASDSHVAFVEADQQYEAPGTPLEAGQVEAVPLASPAPDAVPHYTIWNQDMADTGGSGYDGTGVTVAVVDSGLPQNWSEFLPPNVSVDTEHAAGFGVEGFGDSHSAMNGISGVGGHVGLFPHGLAVASVIVGFPAYNGIVGGAAPGVTLLPVRVLSQFNSGWASWSTAGIVYVGRLKAEGVLTGPVVINFSIQGQNDSAVLTSAIDYAISQGVIFVTIAGNFGPDGGSISFPGRLPQSITAGAVGWAKEWCVPPVCSFPWFAADVPENDPAQVYVASFSGREATPPAVPSRIDVLAPGAFVYGEWLFGPGFSEGRGNSAIDNYIFGTSFAAPHVVGIVAQMLQKNPGLTQSQVESLLRGTALAIPPDPDGVSTRAWYVTSWGADATGAGLARGTASVAATP
jgi:subtilisin family serine protease